jgi:hypothetical protein
MAARGRGEPAQNGALAVGVTHSGRAGATSPTRSDLAPSTTDTAVSDGEISRSATTDGLASRPSQLSPAFTRLKWTSFFHSCVYTSLLICAFALGKPQPETLVLGWTHGLLWIGMSLACITAARMRIVSLRLAVAVAVLGGIGPFFGSAEFVRAQRAYPEGTGKRTARLPGDC